MWQPGSARVMEWVDSAAYWQTHSPRRPFAHIQAVVLVTVAGYVLVNLLVDVAYAFLNPRIRLSGARHD